MTFPAGAELEIGAPHERLLVATQLGVRFWDRALGRPITDGLLALAFPLDMEAPATRGVRGPSGIVSFHRLPGTRALEFPAAEPSPIGSPPQPLRFVIAVADRFRRFLPAVFTVEIPFVPAVVSPPREPPIPLIDAYLFSAPTRPVTTGLCVIRAELWDVEADAAAAHAVLRVQVAGRRGMGVADEEGKVLVLLPNPLLERLRLGSPPGTGQPAPASQSWAVEIEAWYSAGLPRPFAETSPLPTPWTHLPSLKAVLEGQSPALIHAEQSAAPSSPWQGEITYGRELILRTAPGSRLWLSWGPSPL